MLEEIANTVRDNLETILVAPPIIIGTLYLFVKSGDACLQKVYEINEENEQRYREQQKAERD